MMRPHAAIALLCATALLAACGTSPPARFYMLSPTAEPATSTSNLFIAVGPVTVPAVVDRPEIVVRTGANELRLDEFNRWAGPLQDNLARAVAENLVALLGTPRVILYPQALATDPEYRVAIEVRTFDSVPGTAASLDSSWTIRRAKDGKTQTGRTSVRESTTDNGYDALAAAHSRAVAKLSLDIANAIRAMQGGA